MGAIFKPTFPRLQRGHPLAQGLIGSWPLYEGSGPTANDVVNGANGTLSGGPTWGGGRTGSALKFVTGSSQSVRISRTTILEPAAITISVWCNPNAQVGANQVLIGKTYNNNGTSPFLSYGINYDRNANLKWEWFVGTSTFNVEASTSALSLGAWSHLAGTYDGANAKLYFNGQLDASYALTGGIGYDTSSSGDLYFGQAGGGTLYASAQISDPRIWNRAFSAAEVALLYAISGAP